MLIRLRLYGLYVLLFQALLACSPSQNSTNGERQQTGDVDAASSMSPSKNAKLVVAFGDSLYAGYGLGPRDGLAPQLQAALLAKGYDVQVRGAGVSGDTSAGGRARLEFLLGQLPKKPDLVLFGLGGNDMLRGIKPDQTRENLRVSVNSLVRSDIPVLLTGMLASPNMGQDFANEFNGIYPELAKEYEAALYPFILEGVVTDPTLKLSDGIHPNAKGVKRMVEGLLPLVEAELRKNG